MLNENRQNRPPSHPNRLQSTQIYPIDQTIDDQSTKSIKRRPNLHLSPHRVRTYMFPCTSCTCNCSKQTNM
jgi:hypothetical protein